MMHLRIMLYTYWTPLLTATIDRHAVLYDNDALEASRWDEIISN